MNKVHYFIVKTITIRQTKTVINENIINCKCFFQFFHIFYM